MTGHGIFYLFLEHYKKKFKKSEKESKREVLIRNIKASLLAGLFNTILVTPLSVISNIIVSAEKRKGIKIGYL